MASSLCRSLSGLFTISSKLEWWNNRFGETSLWKADFRHGQQSTRRDQGRRIDPVSESCLEKKFAEDWENLLR
jgi:hypothetical protein